MCFGILLKKSAEIIKVAPKIYKLFAGDIYKYILIRWTL